MTITFKSGDMFAEPVEALVNTVNCVGVMGKGVALEFKKRWPENFKVYKEACLAKRLRPGGLLIYDNRQLLSGDGPRYLVNFPTKDHWRSPSKLSFIEDGLEALAAEIQEHGITSIALPPLGCGNGGLDWSVVKPMIADKLGALGNVEIVVFSPKNTIDEPEFTSQAKMPMNYARAMLLKTMAELEVYFDGAFDRISMQKIVYFLQTFGVDFKLGFQKNLYGPYSDTLRKALITFEKRGMIAGFLNEDRRAHVTPAGCAAADEFLQVDRAGADEIIERLSHLIEGYESPYGLELLSSVHWLAHQEKHFPVEKVIEALRNWNERKGNTFDDASVRAAYERLQSDNLIQ